LKSKSKRTCSYIMKLYIIRYVHFRFFLFSRNYSVSFETVLASLLNSINTVHLFGGTNGKNTEKQTRANPNSFGFVRKREMNKKQRREIAGEALHLHGNVSKRRKASGGVGFLKGRRREESCRPARRYIRCYKCHHK